MIAPDSLSKRTSRLPQGDPLLHEPKYQLSKFYSDHQSRSTISFTPDLNRSRYVSAVSPFDPTLELFIRQCIYFEIGRRHTLGLTFDAARVAESSFRQVLLSHEYQDIHRHKIKTTLGLGANWQAAVEAHHKLRSGMYPTTKLES